ncbi:MAG TPA: VOC family protein [Acidimicrobiia bacterium]|nr:VOC family protein [Acidimicrobiia bacterium]
MTDPFETLREPLVPLAPRPEFARELRRQIAAELALAHDEQEQSMPTLEIREYTPARLHSLTPYLAIADPARAIEWYAEAFDAKLLGEPIIMPDGRIGHAEMRVGDTVFMLAGEFPAERHLSPTTLGGSSVGLMLHVPDADATYAKAVDLGATALRPISVRYGARAGTIHDPFGHRWFIQTNLEADDVPVEDVSGRRFGDVGYLTLEVADGERAARFFGALFGWQLDAGYRPGSFHISSITPPSGIHGRPGDPEVKVYFRVDDIEAAAARVRELGGQVLSIDTHESGGNAECVDDQGLRFDLFRPRPGY